MALTPRQELFALEYLKDLNATQAAIRAGYSAKTAKEQGYRLLTNIHVSAYIELHHRPRVEKLALQAADVVEGLRRGAFYDVRNLVRWGEREVEELVTTTTKGKTVKTKRKVLMPFAQLVPSHEVDDDTAAAIGGVKMGAHGVELKMVDRIAALGQLGRHFGIFEKDRADTNVHVTFQIDGAGSPAYEG